ncbi:MAG: sugar-binding transcriptional regulator [Planctomycetes bacterium]|jgi:DNA-binding transcriptional regulator LsrR (DeoR family)|nr:sugar-binding transcriptional regulator [Planctomycetota bacterium]
MTTDTEFSRLLYKVARAYYDDGLTQQQIGERFGLSRVKVSRLLRSAREQKVVQITIAPPQSSNAQIEQQLEHRYGLKEALVVTPSSYAPAVLVGELGPVAAACLMRGLQGSEVVAVSWGMTVLSVVDALPAASMPEMRVVQLIGGLGELEARTHGADLVRRMAQALGAKPRLIHAPGIVKDKMVRDALVMDPQVADTLELAGRADVALVGLGSFDQGSTLLAGRDTLTAAEVEELRGSGVVGDIALQFFDRGGRRVSHPIYERIVGTSIETIQSIPRVIGVAGGLEKIAVIRAALRGGLINVLVTDDQTAARLLEPGDPTTN